MLTQNVFSTGAQKLLLFQNRIRNWQLNRPISPITLEIQPSEKCNHYCPHCQGKLVLGNKDAVNRSRNGSLLDLSILKSIWNNPPEGIVISGNTGDPLLHPEIDRLIEEVESHSIPSVVITNGQLLTPKLSEIIVHKCRGIRISLDACDSTSFRSTHGVGSKKWERLIKNIGDLVSQKKKNPSSECLIGIGFLTSKKSESWMLSATELAKSLGVDYIQFRPYLFDRTNVNNTIKFCEKYERDGFRIFSSQQKYTKLGDCFNSANMGCQAAWFYSVLDAKGDIYLCCHNVGKENAKVGSLNEETWDNFITSRRRKQVIHNFQTDQCVPNCRLHTQNLLLKDISNVDIPALPSVSREIFHHAVFL